LIKYFSTSQINRFKECRRRYFFEYVEGLEPVIKDRNLILGSAYHEGVAAGTDWIAPDPISEIMVNHYRKHIDLELKEVEQKFCVSLGYGIRLIGYIDGITDNYLVEHKTAARVDATYLHHLLWDEQATNYLIASGMDKILYIIIQKCTLKPHKETINKKYKADGTLYANMYDHDEPENEYVERVRSWYDAECRITTQVVSRTTAQKNSHLQDLKNVIKDIKNAAYYRNPKACSIFGCPFASICLEDTPEVREVNFKPKGGRQREDNETF
jgi:hypothetical protein